MRIQYDLGRTMPWTDSGHRSHGVCSARIHDFVNVAYGMLLAEQSAAEAQAYVLDVSQSLQRKPWGSRLRALTTSSSFFSLQSQSMIDPICHFTVLGLSSVDASFLTERSKRDLTGEGMAAPCVCSALIAMAHVLPELWE